MQALKGKQRIHTTRYYDNGTVDHYPEIDMYIPDAAAEANRQIPNRTLDGDNAQWTICFCNCMDKLLYRAGLRVL